MRTKLRFILTTASAGLLGCSSSEAPSASTTDGAVADSDGPEAETSAPLAVSATTRAVPKNPIGAIVDVVTSPGATVTVEATDTSTPSKVADATGKVSLAVLALHPKTTETLHVRAEKDGQSAKTDVTFATAPLPFSLPDAYPPTVTSPGLDGYIMMGAGSVTPPVDVNLILDRKGRIVWAWAPEKNSLFGNFLRMGDDFLVSDEGVKGFRRIDAFGNTIANIRAWGSKETYDSHELLVSGDHFLIIGFDPHEYDSRPYFTDGIEKASRNDNTFDEVDAAGKVYFHFSTFSAITPDEMVDSTGTSIFDPKDTDITHANALDIGPDGDVLMSMRHTSSVIKVSRKDGSVVWRLGGKKSDFTFVDDPLGGFSFQHDVRWVPGKSEIWVYDNGNNHTPPQTRVVRYAIDETAKTAKLLWSFSLDDPKFSIFAGSVRTLPSGNLMIGYAQQGVVVEIEPETKKVVWRTSLGGNALYRAVFTPKLL